MTADNKKNLNTELNLNELENASGGSIRGGYIDVLEDDGIILEGVMSNGKRGEIYFANKMYGSKEGAVEAALRVARITGISTDGIENL